MPRTSLANMYSHCCKHATWISYHPACPRAQEKFDNGNGVICDLRCDGAKTNCWREARKIKEQDGRDDLFKVFETICPIWYVHFPSSYNILSGKMEVQSVRKWDWLKEIPARNLLHKFRDRLSQRPDPRVVFPTTSLQSFEKSLCD